MSYVYNVTAFVLSRMTAAQLQKVEDDTINEYEAVRDRNDSSRVAARAAVGWIFDLLEAERKRRDAWNRLASQDVRGRTETIYRQANPDDGRLNNS